MDPAPKLTDDVLTQAAAESQLAADAELARLRAEVASLKGRYKAALGQIDRERERADTLAGLTNVKSRRSAAAKRPAARTHATAIVVLSDWHVEEGVSLEQTSGLNAYDLEVADARIAELAERIATLVEHERQLVKLDRIVVAALGDFISGHIHEELLETTHLAPLAATRWAAERIRGIVDLCADLAGEVIVVTQPGNHGRSNHGKPRAATEHDHSFEQNAYLVLAGAEPRKNVHWRVNEGYLGHLDLDGFVVRYHHGHAIKYGGGVGGITIPVNKAIAQWNRSRHANLDIFGHWHQFGWLRGRYVSNGSLIGMNAYGIRIKAEFEPPCQAFVVVDHKRHEVTKALPIFCDRDLQRRTRGDDDPDTGTRQRRAAGRGGKAAGRRD
jgi:hypothetical protein